MQSELNFTVDLYFRKDGQWGTFNDSSKTWTGAVGSLFKGEADMFACPLDLTLARAQAVSFLPPTFSDYSTVVIQKKDSSVSWNLFTLPFHL